MELQFPGTPIVAQVIGTGKRAAGGRDHVAADGGGELEQPRSHILEEVGL
jgi:hypothetical protein